MPDKSKLIQEIMAVDFVITDLNLYLNTHPCDMRAINLFNCNVQKSLALKDIFQKYYGPITMGRFQSKCPWQWIEEPWPWEKGGNQ